MFPANFDRCIGIFRDGGQILFGKPPDQKCIEVYNDYNSNLANLLYCAKNRTVAFPQELGFLSLNGRDRFTVTRDFIDRQVFDTSFLKEGLQLVKHSLLPPEFEELKVILLESAEVIDVKRVATFSKLIRYSYGDGYTSYGCRPFDV